MTAIESFLLGFVALASLVAGLFFVKFWRSTRDLLFLAFAAFFLIQGVNDIALLFFVRPNEGSSWLRLIQIFALFLILAAILRKNYGRGR
jgi:uncharacterized membrane protein HdeD (DUF308 family)